MPMGEMNLIVSGRSFGRALYGLFSLGLAVVLYLPASAAQEGVTLQTPQQANDRIRSLSSSAHTSSHDYVIGNGDLLTINVFDVPELDRDVRVSQSGTIGIPLVPVRLSVRGLTESQAEQKIAEVLAANGLVSHPEVGVTVKEHKSKPITIIGAVQHPMVYEADRQVTLLEALAEAGGISADAGDTVIITRARSSAFSEVADATPPAIDLPPGVAASSEPPEISEAKETAPAQAKQAVASTGSAFPSAEELKKVPAVPMTSPAPEPKGPSKPGDATVLTINLNNLLETGDMASNVVLQAGDVVTVPHGGIVYVLGAVVRPGGFVVANDRSELTTLKILALAGGQSRDANLAHAYIIRKDGQGHQTQTEIDLKKILAMKEEDPQVRASDILYVPNSVAKQVLYKSLELAIAMGSSVAIYRAAYH